MKLINFINLFYFQEEIIFLNLCWIRIRFSNFFQVLLGSGLRWAGSTSVRWTFANISNRWLYCRYALSLLTVSGCLRLSWTTGPSLFSVWWLWCSTVSPTTGSTIEVQILGIVMYCTAPRIVLMQIPIRIWPVTKVAITPCHTCFGPFWTELTPVVFSMRIRIQLYGVTLNLLRVCRGWLHQHYR